MIITIGREFGSGGHEIAQKLSEKLNINIYDKDIIRHIALENNISEALVEYYDEKPMSKTFFKYSTSAIEIIDKNYPLEKQIYLAEKQFMLKTAEKEDCIFVGRCGNYIFREEKNILKFFITSPLDKRIERKSKQLNITHDDAKKLIIQTDKKRAEHYKYYTGEIWNNTLNYDFIVNSGSLGIDGSINAIIGIINEYFKK